jgi:hypothetical protein
MRAFLPCTLVAQKPRPKHHIDMASIKHDDSLEFITIMLTDKKIQNHDLDAEARG